MASANKILERVKVREVAGVFRSRDGLDAAVHALLSSGFDRADVDVARLVVRACGFASGVMGVRQVQFRHG